MSKYYTPYLINESKKIKTLELEDKELSRLPENILDYKELKFIKLHANYISDITPLYKLKKIEYLDLSSNNVTSIDLGKFKKLKYVNLSHNHELNELRLVKNIIVQIRERIKTINISFKKFSGVLRFKPYETPKICKKKHFMVIQENAVYRHLKHDDYLCQFGIKKPKTTYRTPIERYSTSCNILQEGVENNWIEEKEDCRFSDHAIAQFFN